jgi:hypothetical protein
MYIALILCVMCVIPVIAGYFKTTFPFFLEKLREFTKERTQDNVMGVNLNLVLLELESRALELSHSE